MTDSSSKRTSREGNFVLTRIELKQKYQKRTVFGLGVTTQKAVEKAVRVAYGVGRSTRPSARCVRAWRWRSGELEINVQAGSVP